MNMKLQQTEYFPRVRTFNQVLMNKIVRRKFVLPYLSNLMFDKKIVKLSYKRGITDALQTLSDL